MLITKLRGIEKYPVISTDVTDLVLIKERKILEYELYIFDFMIHIWLYLQTKGTKKKHIANFSLEMHIFF